MSRLKLWYLKYIVRPKNHLELCDICCSWNPWHHPYTIHAAWCPRFESEYHALPKKWKTWGDFYEVGMPKDSIWNKLFLK